MRQQEMQFENDDHSGSEDFIEQDIEIRDEQDQKAFKRQNKKVLLGKNPSKHPLDKQQREEQTKKLMGDLLEKKQLTQISQIAQDLKKKHMEKQIFGPQNALLKTQNLVREELLFNQFKHQTLQDVATLSKGHGKFRFFILDAVPSAFKKDTIFFFGKAQTETGFVNSCITVNNLQREIYIMPKLGRTVREVEEEVRALIQNHPKDKKVPVTYETVRKKYCFELDVDYRNQETEVLKLSYSFKYPAFSWLNQDGQFFKGVFGLSYKPLELFFLQTQIRGSVWIEVGDYKIDLENKKDGYFNVVVEDYQTAFQRVFNSPKPPSLTVSVLNLVANPEKTKIQ